jgi:hypothetical protein
MKTMNFFRFILSLSFVVLVATFPAHAQDSISRLNIERSRCVEIYQTVAAIEAGEEMFLMEKGHYASKHSDYKRPMYNLCASDAEDCRSNFSVLLGVEIPSNSPFAYEVSGLPAKIIVTVNAARDAGTLCYKFIEGAQKGWWFVNSKHPWAQYLMLEDAQYYS